MFRASLRLARQAASHATVGIVESITSETTCIATRQIVARVESQCASLLALLFSFWRALMVSRGAELAFVCVTH